MSLFTLISCVYVKRELDYGCFAWVSFFNSSGEMSMMLFSEGPDSLSVSRLVLFVYVGLRGSHPDFIISSPA